MDPQRAQEISERDQLWASLRALKPVIEHTVRAFLRSSRPQDCVLLFFVGHAVEIGDEAYLVPIEGELEVKETLIPLRQLVALLTDGRLGPRQVLPHARIREEFWANPA